MATIDLSQYTGTQQIKKIDDKTAIKYRVVGEKVDLEALKREKANLEAMLNVPEPTQEELIELGKSIHEYYQDKTPILQRLEIINSILNQ